MPSNDSRSEISGLICRWCYLGKKGPENDQGNSCRSRCESLSCRDIVRNRNGDGFDQTMFRLWVMCGQVDHLAESAAYWTILRIVCNEAASLGLTPSTSSLTSDFCVYVVSPAKKVGDIAIHDNDRDMSRRVSWRRNYDDRAVFGYTMASIKRSNGLRLEDDRPGRKPLGPSVRQVTSKLTS